MTLGEVYRARDPRLGRDVAIKVLPGAAVVDADRLGRFQREARAAGALGYSPEPNPDELPNQDVKSNAVRRRPPVAAEDLMSNVRAPSGCRRSCVRSSMASTSAMPAECNLFSAPGNMGATP